MYKFFTRLRRVCAVLPLLLTACKSVQSPAQQLPSLPQDPVIQVYFNHAESAKYTEPYRHKQRQGDNLEQQIIDAITQAQSSVDVAVQELRLPKIAQALVEKHNAGVKVRVILENNYSRPWSNFTPAELEKIPQRERDRYQEFRALVDQNRDGKLSATEINQGDALVILNQAQIPWIDDTADGSAGSDLMHHKFVIIDNRTLIVSSSNFTTSDIHGDFAAPESLGNANNLLKIDSQKLASVFTAEFNLMWGDGVGGKPDSRFGLKKPLRLPKQMQVGNNTINVQFSPTSPTVPWSQSSNGLIGEVLNAATQSVDLALFVFSDQRLANILETTHQQKVQIRALIDSSFAYRFYSEGLDMMGVALSNNCQYEPDNHPWQKAIATVGVPQLPKGDLLHHKFGVIDQHTIITGSHNWSEAANTGNDETLLVIKNATVAAHYRREFERLYRSALFGVPVSVQAKIKAQQKQCAQNTVTPRRKEYAAVRVTSEKVNLNTANLAELEALPGIGKKLAQQIIVTRQQQKFTSLQDFERVPGVGRSLIRKLSDRVTW